MDEIKNKESSTDSEAAKKKKGKALEKKEKKRKEVWCQTPLEELQERCWFQHTPR